MHTLAPAAVVTLVPSVVAAPAIAQAADAEVTSDTAAQFYDVRSPTGEVIVPRRRITTTLGVSAYNLLGVREAGETGGRRGSLGPDLLFRARLRYDADYGVAGGEINPADYASFVPGLSRGPADLMYAYVEGRRFLNGWLGFRLGRQYVTDVLGWYGFDGGTLRLTTPVYFTVEAYGGVESRGGMPLTTSRWERDGIWRGTRAGFDPALYPSFQPAGVAPMVGAAVESAGVSWLHSRFSYRRVWNTGDSSASPFTGGLYLPVAYNRSRISQERLGYAIEATAPDLGSARAGLAYDLYAARMANVYGSLDAYVHRKVTVSADYDYYQPIFDGDSIWNFFPAEPTNDVGLRANVDATDKLSLSAGGNVRAFGNQTGKDVDKQNTSPNIGKGGVPNSYPTNGVAFNQGGNLAGRYRWGEGMLGLRGAGNFGNGGQRIGADVYGRRVIETRYILEGRASIWQWDDKLRPDRDAVSLGYVLGLGYRFAPRAQAMLEFDHSMNRLVGHRFRALLWLTVAVAQ